MSSPPMQPPKVKTEPMAEDAMDLEDDDAAIGTTADATTSSSNDAVHMNLNEEIVSSAEVLSGAVDPNVAANVGGAVSGGGAEDEDEDEVVREIDVFISPTLTRKLHLVQFPLTPACAVAASGGGGEHPLPVPTAARVKPRHNLIELDVPVPPAARSSSARQLPDALHMSHRTFASSTIAARTHMGLGVMSTDGRSVHLTPLVNDVVQMRPTFRHIDEAVTRDDHEDDDDTTEATTEAEEAKKKKAQAPTQLSPLLLRKKESERAAAARKSSYAHKIASEEGEEWIDLNIRARGTSEQRGARRAALCPDPGRVLTLAPKAMGGSGSYVRTLNYLPVVVDDEIRSSSEADGDADATVRDLAAKLATLLQRGVPAPFPLLRRRFPHVSTSDLLSALSGCAVLVRGNLILKSSLCGLTSSARNVRDAILILMNRDGVVRRGCMVDFGVSDEVLDHVLRPLAKRVGGGWEMKFEDDDEFAVLYPEFAAMQRSFWTTREGQLAEYLESYDRSVAGDGGVGDYDGNDELQEDWADQ